MNYTERLDQWFRDEKAKGLIVDVKFFCVDSDGSAEKLAQAVYESLTGVRKTEDLDLTSL